MRNHSFLYLLRPDGEEGELERVAESNSVFPALWKILFAEGRAASVDALRVLRGTATCVVEVDAEQALERYRRFADLLAATRPPLDPTGAEKGTGARAEIVPGLSRYMDGAARHMRELIDDYRLRDAARPLFCADFDEMPRPHDDVEKFLDDQLAEHARLWEDLQRLGPSPDARDLEALLGFRESNLRFTDWRAWSGLFGLALFEHEYFQKAFRQPLSWEYVDHGYDPLGVSDDLGGGVHRFREQGRWGVRCEGASGSSVVLSAEWDRVLRASAEAVEVVWVKRGGRFGLASVRGASAGTLLVPPVLDEIDAFEDGIAAVKTGAKMGFLRADGSWLLAPAWDRVWPFRGGRALVETVHHLSYIDSQGIPITNMQFDEADHFTEQGVARVRKGGRHGLMSANGELVLELLYSDIAWSDEFHGWLCRRDGLLTLVHADGGRWLAGEWERIDVCVANECIRVRRAARFGLLDWRGELLLEIAYESLEPLSAGREFQQATLLIARRANRAGVVDHRGITVVPFEFSRIAPLGGAMDVDYEDAEGRFLLVYSLPARARPKLGVWDLRRGCLLAPCEYDRETLPDALTALQTQD